MLNALKAACSPLRASKHCFEIGFRTGVSRTLPDAFRRLTLRFAHTMKTQGNSSRGLLLLREQGRSRLMAAIADDGFGEIRQCVATLHSAGLGDGEEAGRGHLSLGTAIAKDDFAQLHGNA